jgi:hypothetical protein
MNLKDIFKVVNYAPQYTPQFGKSLQEMSDTGKIFLDVYSLGHRWASNFPF